MAVLVDLENVTATRADRTLFSSVDLTIADGDRVGVVGINGTGKSTLLRVLAGADAPEEGVVRRGRGARVAFLEQEPSLSGAVALEAVGSGWEAEAILDRLGLAEQLTTPLSELSGGQLKRLALARALLRPAELLVLDEPTNHLDLDAIAWLEAQLSARRGGLVLVTHDRHLLEAVTTTMVELDRGRAFVHVGGYDDYLSDKVEREEAAAAAEGVRQNLARRELAWLRRGAKARSRKPQARVDAARALVERRPEAPARRNELELGFGTPRLGDKVIECRGLCFAYPGESPVLEGIDLLLGPSERLGLVGVNGSGKSTLLNVLSRRVQPTVGHLEVGPSVKLGYYDQHGAKLDANARVRDLVAGPTRAPGAPEDVALMERFWFTGELPFARVATLSGGERRRLQLLLLLAERPNVVLLDEPTNDLDLDTLRVLEDLFESWPGALVVASHDRVFLERTTERLVALEDGSLIGVPGGVEGWLAARSNHGSSGSGRAAATSPSTRPRGALVDKAGASPSTLGYRLREAEKALGRLERERDAAAEAFGVAEGYEELARVSGELAAAQARLEEAEEAWLALAEALEERRNDLAEVPRQPGATA